MTTVVPRGGGFGTALPAGLAVVAAAAVLLPWWQASRGALLLGAGPLEELPPDTWSGVETAGPRAAVLGGLAVVAVVLTLALVVRAIGGTPSARLALLARCATAATGAVAVAVAVAVLLDRGAGRAAGAWLALLAGSAAVVAAVWTTAPRRARMIVPGVAVLAGLLAVTVVPGGPQPAHRQAVGPFVPLAAVGPFPLRSGAPGLTAGNDVRPVLADGAPGLISGVGIVVADDHGRASVLGRTDPAAPAPLGVAGDRLARWSSADTVTITGLRPDDPLNVVVRGVTEAGPVGADGSVWLRTDADPDGTVRRLDLAERDGAQQLAATFLPVVTIQDLEPPVDVRSVLPVRNGGLRAVPGTGGLELLTGTAFGLAVDPLAETACGAAGSAGLGRVAADGTGVWFVVSGQDGERLAHLDRDHATAVTTVAALLPGHVSALAAPGDGSLLFVASDAAGEALWRLPDAAAALTGEPGPPLDCPTTP